MTRRMVIALLALVGLFVAIYLSMFKLGFIGELTCSVGSCDTVQASQWAEFLGVPVAVWGVGFYVAALALSIVSIQPRFEDSRGMSLAMLVLTGWGLLFSAWLTYLELFVIQAICQWCVISAVIVAGMFIVAVMDLRGVGDGEENQVVSGQSSVVS